MGCFHHLKRCISVVCLSIFFIPLFLFGCSSKSLDIRKSSETIAIQKTKSIDGVDLFLLIDESGSMHGPKGTDPQGLRFSASRYLIQNLLVKKGSEKYPHRLSIIHFGSRSVSLGISDLTIGGAKRLSEAVIPSFTGNLGDTSFIKTLEKVLEIDSSAEAYKNARNKIIVIFTDGEPDDARKLSIAKYFAEIDAFKKEKLKGFSFYIIGIDNAASKVKFSVTIPDWQKIAGGKNVFSLRNLNDLYTKFNLAVQQIFELPQVDQVTVAETQRFEIQPYLDKVEFHILAESNVKVGIRRQNGQLVSAKDKDVVIKMGENYSIITIDSPDPGDKWQYEILEGKGSVNILRNPIPLRLTLVYPNQSYYPLGKPLWIRAQFTRENGEEIKELPDYPLSFTAKITSPDHPNYDEDAQFLPKNKIFKTYYANILQKIDKPGEYHIKLKIKGGTRFETESTHKLFVQSLPYLDFQDPKPLASYPLSEDMKVSCTLKRGHEATDPKKEYEDNPNDLILAQIIASPDEKNSPAVWLNHMGNGKYQGHIPLDMKEGSYSLAVRTKGEPRVSDKLVPKEHIEIIDFHVAPNTWQMVGKITGIGGMIIAVVIVLWLLWIILWLFVMGKKYSGILEISLNEEKILEGFQERLSWIKPRTYVFEVPVESVSDSGSETSTEGPVKTMKQTFWVRAKNEDAVTLYIGGWASVLSMGVFSRKVTLSKEDGFSELGEYIKIMVQGV